jgi:hypothetical protein
MLLAFRDYAGNRWTRAAVGIVIAAAGAAIFYYLPLEGSLRALARFGIGFGGIMVFVGLVLIMSAVPEH